MPRPASTGSQAPDLLRATAEAIASACRRLHGRGLLAGSEGNVSVRLGARDLLVTPSGVDKATIVARQILHLRLSRHEDGSLRYQQLDSLCHGDGDAGGAGDDPGRPSSELGMHLACYDARADVVAVVHAHPPVATGFAAAGVPLRDDVLPELPVVIGPIALVPYGRPGTLALGQALRPYLDGHEAFLLANHGVTAVGRSLEDAVLRMESVEQSARILLVAHVLGGATSLGTAETSALRAMRAMRVGSAAEPDVGRAGQEG